VCVVWIQLYKVYDIMYFLINFKYLIVLVIDMSDEHEFEEFADMAIDELKEFVHTEQQFVHQEHKLIDCIQGMHNVLAHIDERISPEMTHLHKLYHEITAKFLEIEKFVESDTVLHLRFAKEETKLLSKLAADVKHRDWRAVKGEIQDEETVEHSLLRAEARELKELHKHFLELMRMMEKSNVLKVLDRDLTQPEQKEQFAKQEEYYFLQFYKFARAYEQIFRHLFEKERRLLAKLEGAGK